MTSVKVTSVRYRVRFNEHLSEDAVKSMVSGMAACGTIQELNDREYVVEAVRPRSIAWLQQQLTQWDVYGNISRLDDN